MNANRLVKCVKAFGICLFVTAHFFASAQQPSSQTVVPVEQASFHQLVFADEDVSILNNLYPPGGDSGFHAHSRDMFYVVVQGSQSSIQKLGQPLTTGPIIPTGTANYGAVGTGAIHRVVNGDKSAFQIIVVQLLRNEPSGKAVSSRDAVPQYVQILDNSRVRAWRLILKPGQTVPAISQASKGVRVVVHGGLLTTIRSGSQPQILVLRPGEFAVQPASETRALKNSGKETIELVEMELK